MGFRTFVLDSRFAVNTMGGGCCRREALGISTLDFESSDRGSNPREVSYGARHFTLRNNLSETRGPLEICTLKLCVDVCLGHVLAISPRANSQTQGYYVFIIRGLARIWVLKPIGQTNIHRTMPWHFCSWNLTFSDFLVFRLSGFPSSHFRRGVSHPHLGSAEDATS